MKNRLAIIGTVTILSCLLLAPLTLAQTVKVETETVTVAPTETTTFDVKITGLTNGLKLLTVDLNFPTNIAANITHLEGGTVTTDNGGPLSPITDDSDIGEDGKSVKLSVSELTQGPFTGTEGTVYQVTLEGLSSGDTSGPISLSVNEAENKDGDEITDKINTTSGALQVGSPDGPVANLDTGKTFGSIQAAIDDSDTDAGDTIEVDSSTYDSSKEPGGQPVGEEEALIVIEKSVTVRSIGGAESTVIDGRDHPVTVGVAAKGVTFKGFTIKGAAVPSDGKFAAGVGVYSGGLNFNDNIVTKNEWTGIDLLEVQNCQITNNVFSENIHLEDRGGGVGIHLYKSDENLISNNLVKDNEGKGIHLSGSSDNDVTENSVEKNNLFGIEVSPIQEEDGTSIVAPANGNVVSENTVTGTNNIPFDWSGQGIQITTGATETSVVNNTVKSNHVGVVVWRSNANEVMDNTIENNDWYGIELAGSSDCLVESNVVDGNGDFGIFVHSWEDEPPAELNVLADNTVTNTTPFQEDWRGHGIRLNGAENNTLEDNVVSQNKEGINLWVSDNNKLVSNQVTANERFGIKMDGSSNVTLQNNEVKGSSNFGIKIAHVLKDDNTEIAHPAADNEVLANTVAENGFGGIHLKGAETTVKGNEIYGNYLEGDDRVYGLGVFSHDLNPAIEDNDIHDNAFGMVISNREGAKISNNTVKDNTSGRFGMLAVIQSNKETRWTYISAFEGGGGIYLGGPSMEVTNNTVVGNGFGIELSGIWKTGDSVVKNNTVRSNSTGHVTLEVRKEEWTTDNAQANQRVHKGSVIVSNLAPQSAQSQDWEPTESFTVAEPGSFGLLLSNELEASVENNVFEENGDHGIATYGFSFPEYDLHGESSANEFTENEIRGHHSGVTVGPYSYDNTFRENLIKENQLGVEAMEAGGNDFSHNSITGNEDYGAANLAETSLEATDNWWGHPSGPYHPTKNPDGQGNDVSDNVQFEPWLDSSPLKAETTLPQGWNLFSPPGIPVNSDPATSLEDDIEDLTLFYDYTPGEGYTTYPDTDTQLSWEKGYWVNVNSETPVDIGISGPTGEQTIELTNTGWNMIGFPYNVDWSQSSFSNPADFQTDGAGHVRIVSWSPDDEIYYNHYSDSSYVLSPWDGFWVKVEDTPASISVNETSSSASALDKVSPLPQSVDPDELDYPPKPPTYSETDTGLQVLALPNPVSSTQKVVFRVIGSTGKVDKIRAEVFNANGLTIWSGEAQDKTLTWKLKGVANGIYLYKSAVKVDGQWKGLGVAKLLVVK